MGDRLARRLTGLILAASAVVFTSATEAADWGSCRGRDGTCSWFLNVAIRQGGAALKVEDACRGTWRHAWGRRDARNDIAQWLDAEAAAGAAILCIPLAPEVDEIRATSAGGHCGYPEGLASAPDPSITLRAGLGLPGSAVLAGCHARIGAQDFGGIALDFADSYGFGDSYAAGYFYGVYDGFGETRVGATEASVWQISRFNTYHYRVEILAKGSPDWRADFPEGGK